MKFRLGEEVVVDGEGGNCLFFEVGIRFWNYCIYTSRASLPLSCCDKFAEKTDMILLKTLGFERCSRSFQAVIPNAGEGIYGCQVHVSVRYFIEHFLENTYRHVTVKI